MSTLNTDTPYLSGQLLIAMPGMRDPRFAKSVVFVCAHNEDGAMGLVVNRAIREIAFPDLLQQLEITCADPSNDIQVHFGGPVESGRGFVLHSSDYVLDSSLVISEDVALTATLDMLKTIANGAGPAHSLLALGYAGWDAGQLDREITENGWLSVSADRELVFGHDLETKWKRAFAKLGVDAGLLSEEAGHA